MKTVFLGTSHWHSDKYVEIAKDIGLEIAGIHEDDPARLKEREAEWGVPGTTDAALLLDDAKPEFAVTFGTHARMPELISLLVDRGIPFLAEKPCGMSATVVGALADRCRAAGLFNAVAFCYRWDPGYVAIRDLLRSRTLGKVARIRLQLFAGPATRYDEWRCPWVVEKRHSGGGPFMNIGVHLLDILGFLGFDPEYLAGASSWAISGGDVEDVSSLIVRIGDGYAVVECGYRAVAAGTGCPISIDTEKASVEYNLGGPVTISWNTGEVERRECSEPSFAHYAVMAKSVIETCARGEPSSVDLSDMTRVMKVLDRFYGR